MEIAITTACLEDLPAIAAIHIAGLKRTEDGKYLDPVTIQAIERHEQGKLKYIITGVSDTLCLIAKDSSESLGYIIAKKHDAETIEITDFYTVKKPNSPTGSALLHHAILQDSQHKKVIVTPRQDAEQIYSRLGFIMQENGQMVLPHERKIEWQTCKGRYPRYSYDMYIASDALKIQEIPCVGK